MMKEAVSRLNEAVLQIRASMSIGPDPDRVNSKGERKHRQLLIGDLARAIIQGELHLVYQPKFNLRDGRYEGVEALLRWNHPVLGAVDPSKIIDIAEASRQIDRLSLWIIERALADQRDLKDGTEVLAFHINISGQSLANDGFIQRACTLAQTAVGGVGFEITETAFIANPPAALANLERLVAAGIKVSIDDYGSGHSSLAYLKQLPADELKIDRLFVSGMTKSNRDPLIVRSTIDLAHALGMRVVAEGVESLATLALLRVMGCDLAQGYYVSPPLRLVQLRAFLADAAHLGRLNLAETTLTPSRAFWSRDERPAAPENNQ